MKINEYRLLYGFFGVHEFCKELPIDGKACHDLCMTVPSDRLGNLQGLVRLVWGGLDLCIRTQATSMASIFTIRSTISKQDEPWRYGETYVTEMHISHATTYLNVITEFLECSGTLPCLMVNDEVERFLDGLCKRFGVNRCFVYKSVVPYEDR